MKATGILNAKTFLILMVGYVIARVMANQLPYAKDILPSLYQDPHQVETLASPFKVQKDNIEYTVTPLYQYDLSGLIVSQHDIRDWPNHSHTWSKDKINIKDICVIWGNNVKDDNFREMKYVNREFTCFFQTKDRGKFSKFNQDQLSNNHLIFGEPSVGRIIRKARVGDQVRFKGYLSEYANEEWVIRKSSTTRKDRGNGACETVFVKSFEILKVGRPFWRKLQSFFKWTILMIVGIAIYKIFRTPDWRPRRHKKGASENRVAPLYRQNTGKEE